MTLEKAAIVLVIIMSRNRLIQTKFVRQIFVKTSLKMSSKSNLKAQAYRQDTTLDSAGRMAFLLSDKTPSTEVKMEAHNQKLLPTYKKYIRCTRA